jgi:LysM repeat protein
MERSGVPASITLAQGIVESAAGNSKLAREANNHFGIKCGSKWTGPAYYIEDDDYDADGNLMKSCFRKYARAEESYLDHTDFLTASKRYDPLFSLPTTDYKGWATGLKTAGYATNPKYADMLIKCVEDHKLNEYDKQTEKNATLVTADGKKVRNPFIARKADAGVFKNNDLKTVSAKEGETALEIASRYNVPYDRFLKYNDLQANDPLVENQYLYLQKKRNSFFGKKELHPVSEGENMYIISQLYGIKLKTLYCRNRMKMPQEPAIGARLNLRGRAKKTPPTLALNTKPVTPPTTTPKDAKKPSKKDPKAPKDSKKPSKTDPKSATKGTDIAYSRVMDLMEEMLKIKSEKPVEAKETTYTPPVLPSANAAKDSVKTTVKTAVKEPVKPATPPIKVGTGGWVQVGDEPNKPHSPKPAEPPVPAAPKPAPKVEVYVPNTPPQKPNVPNYEQSKNPTKPQITRPIAVMPNAKANVPAGSHEVVDGDTLFNIAKRYNLSVAQLKTLNNLDADAISLGQVLKVK